LKLPKTTKSKFFPSTKICGPNNETGIRLDFQLDS
jgi:hypothetical protein